jgi:hypothetical protein
MGPWRLGNGGKMCGEVSMVGKFHFAHRGKKIGAYGPKLSSPYTLLNLRLLYTVSYTQVEVMFTWQRGVIGTRSKVLVRKCFLLYWNTGSPERAALVGTVKIISSRMTSVAQNAVRKRVQPAFSTRFYAPTVRSAMIATALSVLFSQRTSSYPSSPDGLSWGSLSDTETDAQPR